MIRHIVMFWLKEKDPKVMEDTVALIKGMEGRIPGMLTLDAGADFLSSPRSCDLCLCATFTTREALEVYQTYPVHLPVKAHMHAIMDHSASADYEVPQA